jgi:hypothetical protein
MSSADQGTWAANPRDSSGRQCYFHPLWTAEVGGFEEWRRPATGAAEPPTGWARGTT